LSGNGGDGGRDVRHHSRLLERPSTASPRLAAVKELPVVVILAILWIMFATVITGFTW
jgi:hypothetical protein